MGTAWIAFVELNKARAVAQIQAPLLDVYFAHMDHREVGCAQCHHNYVDGVGRHLACYQCHKEDETVNQKVIQQFHGLCQGCHIERHQAAKDTGPLRRCSECHRLDTKP